MAEPRDGGGLPFSLDDERSRIRRLVRELGGGAGRRRVTPEEVAQLRDFFGRHVLRRHVDAYVLRKYVAHVEDDLQWPGDTTSEEYLASLRATVLAPESGIYLTDANPSQEWAVYFVGRVRRSWRGPNGASRLVVIFNGERHVWVTGFQPDDGDAYVERQGGFWLVRP